jgi:collagen type VII alpha
MVANVGREPDVSPSYWGLLAASGAQGPVGPAGAMGLQGPTGFPGATGATGATGTQGVAGPAGAMGPAGPVGPAGPAGATGAAGPAGLVWQGAYASGVNYNVGDAVSYGGASYVSLVTGNAGQTPSASPSSWALLAAAGTNGLTGATGATGSIGPAGPMGATGAAGTNGSNGVNGTPGLVWQGAWASSTSYAANDAVSYGGASYVSLMAGNLGQLPGSSPSSWTLLAAAGSAGANGAVGVTGATGAPGATGPQGPAGATGATGAAGAVGMNYRGVWNSGLNYLANDAVTFQGSTYLAQMAGTDLQPDANPAAWQVIAQAGGAGPTGAAGAAATVTVGTVTTLSAGAQATVSNSGTAQAAVLNFGIPQGVQGTAGSGGSGGSAVSNGFASMYHTVSYATTYYSINSPTASATESASVMTWIPNACTLTGLTAYSQQSNMITVSVRVVIPTPAAAVMSCSVATNSSCSATGSVAIAAGSFLDLEIDNPSGTPTGVWTSVTCQ